MQKHTVIANVDATSNAMYSHTHTHKHGECVLFSIAMMSIPKQLNSKTSIHTDCCSTCSPGVGHFAFIFSNELALIVQQRNPTHTTQDRPWHCKTETAGDALNSVEKKMRKYTNTYENTHTHYYAIWKSSMHTMNDTCKATHDASFFFFATHNVVASPLMPIALFGRGDMKLLFVGGGL